MLKKIAVIIALSVLSLALFKCVLLANNPGAYCAFGPFARDCHDTPNFSELLQALRSVSRALPFGVLLFIFSLLALLAETNAARAKSISAHSSRGAQYHRTVHHSAARVKFLAWIEHHETGSPAAA